ncbi:MAG: hypothetical protein M5U34_36215 [Chloroflexi bacterium]|nr:hypothetical protein [Chloroflexota bacterium]
MGKLPHFHPRIQHKLSCSVPPLSRWRGSGDPLAKTAVSYLSLIFLEAVPTPRFAPFRPGSPSIAFAEG